MNGIRTQKTLQKSLQVALKLSRINDDLCDALDRLNEIYENDLHDLQSHLMLASPSCYHAEFCQVWSAMELLSTNLDGFNTVYCDTEDHMQMIDKDRQITDGQTAKIVANEQARQSA